MRNRLIGVALTATLTLVACGDGDANAADTTTTTSTTVTANGEDTTTATAAEGCEQGTPADDPAADAVYNATVSTLPETIILESESTRENIDNPDQLEVSLFICSAHLDDNAAVDLALDLARALETSEVGDRIIRMGVNLFSPQGGEFPDTDGQVIAAAFDLHEWNADEADEGALRAGLELRR